MKTPVIILALSIIAAGAIITVNKPEPLAKKARISNKPTPPKSNLPSTTIEWKDTLFNAGTIVDGEELEVVYSFKNTGSEVLVFSDIKASCGCTIPEKPEKPILPGSSGIIKALFNSKGRIGSNHKVLTAFANTKEGSQQLIFDVEVVNSKK
jgi:hypothetical protein